MRISPLLCALPLGALVLAPATSAREANLVNVMQPEAFQVMPLGRPVQRNLPPTSMDSFVLNAGAQAELIYGDEGVTDPPPYDNFTKEHRINAGIFGVRDLGLTTGHGSFMPDAWGADEFIGNEWDRTGANANMINPPVIPATTQGQLSTVVGNMVGGAASLDANGAPSIPPPPGPGYQAVYTHGVFDGYLTPQEANMWNSGDQSSAWKSYANRRPGGPTQNDIFIITQEMGGSWP